MNSSGDNFDLDADNYETFCIHNNLLNPQRLRIQSANGQFFTIQEKYFVKLPIADGDPSLNEVVISTMVNMFPNSKHFMKFKGCHLADVIDMFNISTFNNSKIFTSAYIPYNTLNLIKERLNSRKIQFQHRKSPAIVFENINGKTIEKQFREQTIVYSNQLAIMIFDLLFALRSAAETYGFIHNDLHLGNVMMSNDENCFVIIDYGRSGIHDCTQLINCKPIQTAICKYINTTLSNVKVKDCSSITSLYDFFKSNNIRIEYQNRPYNQAENCMKKYIDLCDHMCFGVQMWCNIFRYIQFDWFVLDSRLPLAFVAQDVGTLINGLDAMLASPNIFVQVFSISIFWCALYLWGFIQCANNKNFNMFPVGYTKNNPNIQLQFPLVHSIVGKYTYAIPRQSFWDNSIDVPIYKSGQVQPDYYALASSYMEEGLRTYKEKFDELFNKWKTLNIHTPNGMVAGTTIQKTKRKIGTSGLKFCNFKDLSMVNTVKKLRDYQNGLIDVPLVYYTCKTHQAPVCTHSSKRCLETLKIRYKDASKSELSYLLRLREKSKHIDNKMHVSMTFTKKQLIVIGKQYIRSASLLTKEQLVDALLRFIK